MSGAFIEPLEASAIFLVEAAVNMLAEQFPRTRNDMRYVAGQFNSIYQMRWDKTIDFVKLHYCISKRRDSQYWIDNCDPASIPDSLAEKLDYWRTHVPSKYEFEQAFEPFVLDSYLFVLYGMEFDVDLSASAEFFNRAKEAQRKFDEISRTVAQLSQQLPSHRKLIKQVHQHGFSTI